MQPSMKRQGYIYEKSCVQFDPSTCQNKSRRNVRPWSASVVTICNGNNHERLKVRKRRPISAYHISNRTLQQTKDTLCARDTPACDKHASPKGITVVAPTPASEDQCLEDKRVISIPESVKPLERHLTSCVSTRKMVGLSGVHCLMFLAPLEELPMLIPSPQRPSDDLVYFSIPEKEAKIHTPKKYDHPWTKRSIDNYVCRHVPSKKISECSPAEHDDTYYNYNNSLNERRTATVVRDEILELENLMRGVGDSHGTTTFSQYQDELNTINSMITSMLPEIERIERREREKVEKERKNNDTFGLQSFCNRHDRLMRRIRNRYEQCVLELATIESEMKIETPRTHFRDRLPGHNELAGSQVDTHIQDAQKMLPISNGTDEDATFNFRSGSPVT